MGLKIRKAAKDSCSTGTTRREILRAAAVTFVFLSELRRHLLQAAALDISNRLSPKNSKRPRRPGTSYIVLHTTEGEEAGSLNKIHRLGEAHYFVGISGKVYRIIDKDRIATHVGRSMWNGRSTIDNHSIGIEIVGYHNQEIADAQYAALRELLRQLQSLYRIPDSDVVTHSMVAYGRPNRFHDSNHRGRKRCGMIFARTDVRARLGLKAKPEEDPDVKQGRLKIGDPELFQFLFARAQVSTAGKVAAAPPESNMISRERTAWQIARELYNHPKTIYLLPTGEKLRGNEVRDWGKIPPGTRVQAAETGDTQGFEGFLEIGKDGDTPRQLAGEDFDKRSTIYFFPDGLIRTGLELTRQNSMRSLLVRPPAGTRVLVGYVYGGYVKSKRSPSSIAGIKWNYPSTFYRLPNNSIVSGDEIDASAIPAGTLIFYQN